MPMDTGDGRFASTARCAIERRSGEWARCAGDDASPHRLRSALTCSVLPDGTMIFIRRSPNLG
jgi:hypothetical protein